MYNECFIRVCEIYTSFWAIMSASIIVFYSTCTCKLFCRKVGDRTITFLIFKCMHTCNYYACILYMYLSQVFGQNFRNWTQCSCSFMYLIVRHIKFTQNLYACTYKVFFKFMEIFLAFMILSNTNYVLLYICYMFSRIKIYGWFWY